MEHNSIGAILVELRGNRTQEEVAKALDISPSALSSYENGSRIPETYTKDFFCLISTH